METDKDEKQIYTVSEALARAKDALENIESFPLRLVGEVSELSNKPGYKAVYFTVKDEKASLPCMMWNNRFQASNVDLAVGQRVELTGRFTLYAAKGRMNFDVATLTLAGEGDLRLQVERLARKLESEGLMRPERKRKLPTYPQRIGLVTSPRGAVVHDVLRTLRRRFPVAKVVLAGVPVEGANAAADIIQGLHCVADADVEVILIVRGGGSFEDLMPFNDENLARAIADHDRIKVPVVTGIGHEPDTTIADMVADVRASTPTAAAEAVSPAREELMQVFEARANALSSSVTRCFERCQTRLAHATDRPLFRDSNQLFAADKQKLDDLAYRLTQALPAGLERDSARLAIAANRLRTVLPRVVERERALFVALYGRMDIAGRGLVSRFEAQTGLMAARLHDLSPLAILARGYSVARNEAGTIVKSIDQVNAGASLDISVADGEIACSVERTKRIEISVEAWEENT